MILRRIRLYTLVALSLATLSVAAQSRLSGTVRSESGEPLPGVTVVADSTLGTLTDTAGHYTLSLGEGAHRLAFRLLGFRTAERTVTLGAQSSVLDIRLAASAQDLDVVVVSAGRHEQKIEDVTVSMEVIRPSLVEHLNATSMEAVVDQVPGVNIIDGQVSIRGGAGWSYGAGSRVLVLVDDMPQLSADAGDAKWGFIPTENLEQVEVIKGASSALFGSAALNGVIHFRTAYPGDTPRTRVGWFWSVYDKPVLHLGDDTHNLKWWSGSQMTAGLNFLHSEKAGRLDLVAGGNMLLDQGYRKDEDENRARFNLNTRYRTGVDGLAFGINVNVQTAEGGLFFIWKDDTTGAYLPQAGTISEYTNNKYTVDPYITYAGRHGTSHKLRTRFFDNTNQNNTQQNSTSNVYFAEYQYQKRFRDDRLVLTAGAAEQYSTIRSELYGDHDGNNIAGYVQADARKGAFGFSAGSRLEQNRIDGQDDKARIVFRAGVNWHVAGATWARVSAGQGYRFPSVAERYVTTSVGGLGIYPNGGLEAESGFSAEAGVRQVVQSGRWRGAADLAVFLNRYDNMIEFAFAQWGNPFTDPAFGYGFRSVNVGNTEIKGVELSLSGNGTLPGGLQLELLAGYTYMDPRQVSYSDSYLNSVPPTYVMGSDSSNFLKYRYRHLARFDATVTRGRLSLGASVRYNSFMVNIDKVFVDNVGRLLVPGVDQYRALRTGGDIVTDARVAWQVSPHWKATFLGKNIFNYIYMQRPADMQAPRTWVLQMNFSW